MQDVGSQCSNTEGSTSPIIQRKLELDKVCACVAVCWVDFYHLNQSENLFSVLSKRVASHCFLHCKSILKQFYSFYIFNDRLTKPKRDTSVPSASGCSERGDIIAAAFKQPRGCRANERRARRHGSYNPCRKSSF